LSETQLHMQEQRRRDTHLQWAVFKKMRGVASACRASKAVEEQFAGIVISMLQEALAGDVHGNALG
jgi:hypothetical protein